MVRSVSDTPAAKSRAVVMLPVADHVPSAAAAGVAKARDDNINPAPKITPSFLAFVRIMLMSKSSPSPTRSASLAGVDP